MEQASLDALCAQILSHQQGSIQISQFFVELTLLEKGELISLRTIIYEGGDYLPQSIRLCIHGGELRVTAGNIHVELMIDEENKSVLLHAQMEWKAGSIGDLRELLHEFVQLAEEWRRLLDDYGEQDLIYVPVR